MMRTEGKDEYEGYCMDLLKKINEIYNFSYTIQVEPNNMYGTEINGTYNGMIGQLVNNVRNDSIVDISFIHFRRTKGKRVTCLQDKIKGCIR